MAFVIDAPIAEMATVMDAGAHADAESFAIEMFGEIFWLAIGVLLVHTASRFGMLPSFSLLV
eukprot:CAMPEP_0176301312 /NCGR_PEP_ID=MMETSP0121_2-20121125/60788_1 /TAXON_ID=160619 /ORGANISM="Kryptoperidinium foliaceum, Strain CCMP 1326" /LENGTH=61 /DNA_ID=CAMNT_0017642759 /DNA_START=155 /DNA_END=337 /DNA_ORIENTATION=+